MKLTYATRLTSFNLIKQLKRKKEEEGRVRRGQCKVEVVKRAGRRTQGGGIVPYEQVICLAGSLLLKGLRKVRCQVNVTGEKSVSLFLGFLWAFCNAGDKRRTAHSV